MTATPVLSVSGPDSSNHCFNPTTAFPVELLREIFSIVCILDLGSMLAINGSPTPNDALHISHVCQRWRAIALETAVLWTHISFVSIDMAEAFVARAQNSPLWVVFTTTSGSDAIDSDIAERRFKLFETCLPRAVHLGVVISINDPGDYGTRISKALENFSACRPSSNLRTLNFRRDVDASNSHYQLPDPTFPPYLRALTPSLSHLTLSLPMASFAEAGEEDVDGITSLPALRNGTPSVLLRLINGDVAMEVGIREVDAPTSFSETSTTPIADIPALQLFAKRSGWDVDIDSETIFLPFLKPTTIESLHLAQSRDESVRTVPRHKLRMGAPVELFAELTRVRDLSLTVFDLSIMLSSLYTLGMNKVQLDTLTIQAIGNEQFDPRSGCDRHLTFELTALIQRGVIIRHLRINASEATFTSVEAAQLRAIVPVVEFIGGS